MSVMVLGLLPGKAEASTPTALASIECKDLYLLGARGSGQKYTKQFGLLGPEVYGALNPLLGKTHYSAEAVAVPYFADGVSEDLTPTRQQADDFLAGGLRSYVAVVNYVKQVQHFFVSINDGINRTDRFLSEHRQACPESRYILAGFSQGAMVMHSELVNLERRRAGGTLNAIVANILIADGDRVANSRAILSGTGARSGTGVRPTFKITNTDIPAAVAGKTFNVCNARDIVCDNRFFEDLFYAGLAHNPLVLPYLLYNEGLVHTKSYPGSGALLGATNAVLRRLLGRPITCSNVTYQYATENGTGDVTATDTGCVTARLLENAVNALPGDQLPYYDNSTVVRTLNGYQCAIYKPVGGYGGFYRVACQQGRAVVRFGYGR